MPRPAKSQWEFEDLFNRQPPSGPPEPQVEKPRKALSVSELTAKIRRILEGQVGQVWVTGEITNLRAQSSGHIYFTLKDTGAQMSCVLFRGETQANRSLLQDGREVTLTGDLTVYEARGQYQLRVTRIELQGLGALQAAFEQLKAKLNAEGLFSPERKRPLPRFAARIGIVASRSGAALRDVLHVVQRRNPSLEIILAPSRVQGEGAAEEIAAGIRLLNEFHSRAGLPLDLILITRGGGSLEDLWAFNEEVVARAIFESGLPVVSGVGHEIDFTISDFVADVRAATPSAAAEIITEGVFSSCQILSDARARMHQLVLQQAEAKRRLLAQGMQRLARSHPRRRLEAWLQQLDEAESTMQRCARQSARRYRSAWQTLTERLTRVRPVMQLQRRRDRVEQVCERLMESARHRMKEQVQRLRNAEARLRLLGPEQVLGRGYSITLDAITGQVVRDARTVLPGQKLRTRLKTGELLSRAEGEAGSQNR
jgi:exodeoxyribonuclease VII large subunit